MLVPETKNDKPRTIPLSNQAFEILVGLRKGRADQLIPITPSAVKQAWRRLLVRADIDDLRFHDLRHEAISRLFEKGLNLAEVMLVSGHQDHRMLLRYTHLEAGNLVAKM